MHKVFKRWRAVNLHWDVQNYDKEADVEESSGGGSGGMDPGSGRTLWLPLAALQPGSALHSTQLAARPSRCSRVVLWLCAGLAGPRASEADAGEVVIRVTSV